MEREIGMNQMYEHRERQEKTSPLNIHPPGSLCAAEFLSLDSLRQFFTFIIILTFFSKQDPFGFLLSATNTSERYNHIYPEAYT